MAFATKQLAAAIGAYTINGMNADLVGAIGARSGATVTVPGTYELVFDFTVTGIAAAIKIRGNAEGADGEGDAMTITTDGAYTFRFFANVTAADLAAGTVSIVIQAATAAGSDTVEWENGSMAIRRIGGAK